MDDLNDSIREEDISNEILIEEIKKRAALYKKHLKDYSNVVMKKRLWIEICEILFPDKWEGWTEEQQVNTGNQVQKRWKNIRACFSRELRNQKLTKSGQAPVKKRKYIYFDQLQFLMPHMDNRETGTNISPIHEETQEYMTEIKNKGHTRIKMTDNAATRTKTKKVSYKEEPLLQILKEKKVHEDDQETHFALSLVPMLKQLSADEKLDAQIRILQVFKSIKQQTSQEQHK